MIPRALEWWALLLCCGLFVVGAVRVGAGFKRAAGMRDSWRWFLGAVRFIAGIAGVAFLTWADLPGRIGPPLGVVVAAVAFAVPVWLALAGFMRVLLLSWPRGAAFGETTGHIRGDEFSWDEQRRRSGFWWRR
jgi:hypothetical protein